MTYSASKDKMKYLLYPPGFDPVVASGPPAESYLKLEISWTPEETEKAKYLESQAVVSDYPPGEGQWYMVLENEI